jgi:hypothetical protein
VGAERVREVKRRKEREETRERERKKAARKSRKAVGSFSIDSDGREKHIEG